jgi:hypothetical protein
MGEVGRLRPTWERPPRRSDVSRAAPMESRSGRSHFNGSVCLTPMTSALGLEVVVGRDRGAVPLDLRRSLAVAPIGGLTLSVVGWRS